MAEELRESINVDAELVPGPSGIFDVIADGKLVFSKFQIGRFPNSGEVSERLKQK